MKYCSEELIAKYFKPEELIGLGVCATKISNSIINIKICKKCHHARLIDGKYWCEMFESPANSYAELCGNIEEC